MRNRILANLVRPAFVPRLHPLHPHIRPTPTLLPVLRNTWVKGQRQKMENSKTNEKNIWSFWWQSKDREGRWGGQRERGGARESIKIKMPRGGVIKWLPLLSRAQWASCCLQAFSSPSTCTALHRSVSCAYFSSTQWSFVVMPFWLQDALARQHKTNTFSEYTFMYLLPSALALVLVWWWNCSQDLKILWKVSEQCRK